jgi:hypothetical protein
MDKGEVVTKPAALGGEGGDRRLRRREGERDPGHAAANGCATFPSFRKVPQIVELGVFSNPPRLEDLAGLTIDAADLDALEDCKPGNCAVKSGRRGSIA